MSCTKSQWRCRLSLKWPSLVTLRTVAFHAVRAEQSPGLLRPRTAEAIGTKESPSELRVRSDSRLTYGLLPRCLLHLTSRTVVCAEYIRPLNGTALVPGHDGLRASVLVTVSTVRRASGRSDQFALSGGGPSRSSKVAAPAAPPAPGHSRRARMGGPRSRPSVRGTGTPSRPAGRFSPARWQPPGTVPEPVRLRSAALERADRYVADLAVLVAESNDTLLPRPTLTRGG